MYRIKSRKLWVFCVGQDIVRLLFGKDVKDVDVDMVIKKRKELMADRGKKVQ